LCFQYFSNLANDLDITSNYVPLFSDLQTDSSLLALLPSMSDNIPVLAPGATISQRRSFPDSTSDVTRSFFSFERLSLIHPLFFRNFNHRWKAQEPAAPKRDGEAAAAAGWVLARRLSVSAAMLISTWDSRPYLLI
jgi:hypothetical protein